MLGIPLPDPTKSSGASDIVEPTQTNDSLLQAKESQKFAWSPQQTKQVQDTMRTRTADEAQKSYRASVLQKAQSIQVEIDRYSAMIQEESARIQQLRSDISQLSSEASRLKSEADRNMQEASKQPAPDPNLDAIRQVGIDEANKKLALFSDPEALRRSILEREAANKYAGMDDWATRYGDRYK